MHSSSHTVRSGPRALRATALESLETRRLFAYALDTTITSPAPTDPALGEIVLATRGNRALVGQPGALQAILFNTATGAAIQTLTLPGNPPIEGDDTFGFAVAFVGDHHIAVSSPDFEGGAVYVFDDIDDPADVNDDDANFHIARRLDRPASHDGPFGGFGETLVALDNNILMVAEPFAKNVGLDLQQGMVELFNVTTGAHEGTFESSLPSGAFTPNQLGNAMASNGTNVLLSANTEDGWMVLEYSVASATPSGSTFQARQITLPSSTIPGVLSLAYGDADGDNVPDEIIVGDALDSVVYVYPAADESGSNPTPLLTISSDQTDTDFGANVVVRGNDLLVTAHDSPTGAEPIFAYVFDYTGLADPGPTDPQLQSLADAVDVIENETVIAGPGETTFGVVAGASTDGWIIGDDFANGGNGALYAFSEVAPPPSAPTAVLTDGNLLVTGTGNGEVIVVTGTDGGLIVLVDGVQIGGTFAVTGEVVIHGGAGNDTITSDRTNPFPTTIYGGDGDDSITGGGGNDMMFGDAGNDTIRASQGSDVAVGGDGNDALFGGNGTDILIGGRGSDNLAGENGQDILIAGYTDHDEDPAALAAIRTTWMSGDTYSARVNSLSGGLLGTTAVHDDEEDDVLAGGNAQDWFLVIGEGDCIDNRNETVS